MPDENRFAGLGDQLEGDERDDTDDGDDTPDTADATDTPDATDATDATDADETASAAPSPAESADSASSTTESESASDSTSDDSEPTPDLDETSSTAPAAESGPAFSFDDTRAKSLYVRPETVELLEDAEFEVEALLRRDHGIRDLTGREFHDALVRAVAADPEAVVEFVVDARDE